MRLFGSVCSGLWILCSSCSGPASSTAPFELTEQGGDLEAVPQVLRLELTGLEEVPNQDIWLIHGELSSTNQNKLRAFETPDAVTKKRVPLASYSQGNRRTFAATELLERGQSYSLIAVGYGLLGNVRTAEFEEPLLTRVGQGDVPPGGYITYCSGQGSRREWEAEAKLFSWEDLPPGASLGLAAGVGEGHCVRFMAEPQAGEFFVPPARIGAHLLSPGLVRVGEQDSEGPADDAPVAMECAGAVPLKRGDACLSVGDSFLRLSVAAGPALLELEGPVSDEQGKVHTALRQLFVHTEGNELQTWGPLLPDTEYILRIRGLGNSGLTSGRVQAEQEFSLKTAPPAPRWVLSEVLADPQGSEPQAEWIEVVNAGTAKGSLGGLELWDSSGGVALPEVSLAPGEFGLFVRADFEFSEDRLPATASVPIVVPSLGQNGLKNSGERVELRDAEGAVISSFPAKAGKAGQSIARLSLWSSDDDATQFIFHGAPGSSPGATNGILDGAETEK